MIKVKLVKNKNDDNWEFAKVIEVTIWLVEVGIVEHQFGMISDKLQKW